MKILFLYLSFCTFIFLSSCNKTEDINKSQNNLKQLVRVEVGDSISPAHSIKGRLVLLEGVSLNKPITPYVLIFPMEDNTLTVKLDECLLSNTRRSCEFTVSANPYAKLGKSISLSVRAEEFNGNINSNKISVVDQKSLVIMPLSFDSVVMDQDTTFTINILRQSGDVQPTADNITLELDNFAAGDIDGYVCNATQDFVTCKVDMHADSKYTFRIKVLTINDSREYSEGYSTPINVIGPITLKFDFFNSKMTINEKQDRLFNMEIPQDVILASPVIIPFSVDDSNSINVTPTQCEFDYKHPNCPVTLDAGDHAGVTYFHVKAGHETIMSQKIEIKNT